MLDAFRVMLVVQCVGDVVQLARGSNRVMSTAHAKRYSTGQQPSTVNVWGTDGGGGGVNTPAGNIVQLSEVDKIL